MKFVEVVMLIATAGASLSLFEGIPRRFGQGILAIIIVLLLCIIAINTECIR